MNDFLNIIYPAVNYTATDVDQYIGATVSGIIITLPIGILGRIYQIKNQSIGDIQIQGTGGELVEGSASKTLRTNSGITVVFDGTTWKIL
jgi:hypothetical protein